MANNKHLTFTERAEIEHGLLNGYSFKSIGRELSKDCTNISKEVKNHIQFKKVGSLGNFFNDCIHRYDCSYKQLCSNECRKNVLNVIYTVESMKSRIAPNF